MLISAQVLASNTARFALVIFLLLIDLALIGYVEVGGDITIYVENSWMENIQVVLLYLVCIVFFIQAFKVGKAHKAICYLMSMIGFIFAFREVDYDKLDIPSWMIFMLAEQGRGFFIIIALGLLVYIAKDIRFYWQYKQYYFRSFSFFSFMLAFFILLIFSHMFDRKWVHVNHQAFYEELSELTAYICLFTFSLFAGTEFCSIEQKQSSFNE